MEKMSNIFTQPILEQINTKFKAMTVTEELPEGITLFSDVTTAFIDYVLKYGDLFASTLLEMFDKETITATQVATIIVNKYYKQWVHYLGIYNAEYNPVWNVDGTEVRTIETTYGKTDTMTHGLTVTTEQKENETTTLQHGLKTTTDQTKDGETTDTYGRTIVTNQGQDTSTIAYGKKDDIVANDNSITENSGYGYNVSQGTSIGKSVVNNNNSSSDTLSGSDTTTNTYGDVTNTNSGTDTHKFNNGKTEVSNSGSDTTTHDLGKVEVSNTGNDVNKASGIDKVVDEFIRGGNIGTTMTQQLLSAELDFWRSYNFIDMIFCDINKELTIPLWS